MRKTRVKTAALMSALICVLTSAMGNVLSVGAQEDTASVWVETLQQENMQQENTAPAGTETEAQEDSNVGESSQEAGDALAEVADEEILLLPETYSAALNEEGAAAENAAESAVEITVESVEEVDSDETLMQRGNTEAAAVSEEEWKPEDISVVTIPADVTSINAADFYKMKSIETILVEDGNTAFISRDGILYDKTGTKLLVYPAGRTEHVIPEGTTVIGRAAFLGQQMSEIVLPDTVTKLETSAFGGVTLPKETVVSLPSSLQVIEAGALEFEEPVKGIIIPSSVKSIGHWGIHTDIAVLQGKDTQLDEHPFFRLTAGMLIGGLPGSTAEKWVTQLDYDPYRFAELGEDGKIAVDPSWIYVKGFFIYSGKPIEPQYGITAEAPDQFYFNVKLQLSCSNNVNAGWATAVVSVDDEVFSGSVERKYMIPPTSILGKKIVSIPDQVYTGRALRPKVEMPGLEEGKDFTVQYSNNVSIGEAEVTIRGIGNYGYKTRTSFKIVAPPRPSSQVSSGTEPGQGATTDGATVGTQSDGNNWKTSWRWLVMGEDKEVRKPQGTTVSSLKAGKKKITVKWKKISGITGYQIQYSTSKKFKSGKKTMTVSGSGSSKCVIKKLKARKRYYVRIRTYSKVNGKKEYSAWSAAKKVKVK